MSLALALAMLFITEKLPEIVPPSSKTPQIISLSPFSAADALNRERRKSKKKGSARPESAVLYPDQPIRLVFDRAMKMSSMENFIRLTPPFDFEAIWHDEKTLEIFVAEKKDESQKFEIDIFAGIPAKNGFVTREQLRWNIWRNVPKLLLVKMGATVLRHEGNDFFIPADTPSGDLFFQWNVSVDVEEFFHELKIYPERKATDAVLIDSIIKLPEDPRVLRLHFDPPLKRKDVFFIEVRKWKIREERTSSLQWSISPENLLFFEKMRSVFDSY